MDKEKREGLIVKTIIQQTKEVAFYCIILGAVCVMASQLGGCGKVGPMGPQGETGLQGTPGENCSVVTVPPSNGEGGSLLVPNGGSLITCPNSQSLVLNGSNGENGTAGTPGTVVTPVQLCPGATTYPNEFNELAFCVQGNLYAVYSQNNGFLSEIPPGEYESNGVSASCTFTVEANCVVENN